MKRLFYLLVFLLCAVQFTMAQGLRHSVCIVYPEIQEAEKNIMGDYSLYMARAGLHSASRALSIYKEDGTFGSGVVVAHEGEKYVLTNLHVIGYAEKATIVFKLHEKTLRYEHCPVVSIGLSDLAAIKLPAECEMIPLSLYEGEILEEAPIVAAGFPGLANNPSWQLTRGNISNAHVDLRNGKNTIRIIQHTAPIDPGSSGGPLLVKNTNNKYEILGVNTWKVFAREGVGLAIGKEDIQSFLATLQNPQTTIRHSIDPLRSMPGKDWLYIFQHLPEADKDSITEMDWDLPFEQALKVLDLRDSLIATNDGKRFDPYATRIITNLDSRNHLHLIYDNYFGVNQQITVRMGHDWGGYVITGVQVSVLLVDAMKEGEMSEPLGYQTCAGVLFGGYLGGQVPIQVGKYILVPNITQGAAGGFLATGSFENGYAINTDTRIGLNWHMPFKYCDLVLGLHYALDLLWTPDNLSITPYKAQEDKNALNHYLQHGIGLSIGIAF